MRGRIRSEQGYVEFSLTSLFEIAVNRNWCAIAARYIASRIKELIKYRKSGCSNEYHPSTIAFMRFQTFSAKQSRQTAPIKNKLGSTDKLHVRQLRIIERRRQQQDATRA